MFYTHLSPFSSQILMRQIVNPIQSLSFTFSIKIQNRESLDLLTMFCCFSLGCLALPWQRPYKQKRFKLNHSYLACLIKEFYIYYYPTLWSHDPYTLIEITEDPKKLLLIWIITIYSYHIRNQNWEFLNYRFI